jgi:hypothetical protein
MSCPHARHGSPDRCSLCLQAVPKRVIQLGATVTVDGEPPRQIEPAPAERDAVRRRRGGSRTGGTRR